LEIQRQYNGVEFTIAEACSAEYTDDEALVDDGQSQARPLRRVVPYWRPLELHEALAAVNGQREQNILAQKVQHTELRPRRDAAPVRYPSLDADVEPLPSIIQRWMVSSEFARLFQEAVKHVSLNTILPNQASAMIKDPEQWGQHPPYDVLRSSETYQDHAELDPALFLGNNDSLGDVNEPGGDSLLCSDSGEERLVVPGPNRSLFQRRRWFSAIVRRIDPLNCFVASVLLYFLSFVALIVDSVSPLLNANGLCFAAKFVSDRAAWKYVVVMLNVWLKWSKARKASQVEAQYKRNKQSAANEAQ
jgi:hypothetical protein